MDYDDITPYRETGRWAQAHGWPYGFPQWDQMPAVIKPKWEAVAAAVLEKHGR